jgi:hypothetical protein
METGFLFKITFTRDKHWVSKPGHFFKKKALQLHVRSAVTNEMCACNKKNYKIRLNVTLIINAHRLRLNSFWI